MSLGALLIILGVVLFFVFSPPIVGIVVAIVGICYVVFRGGFVGGGTRHNRW